MSEKTLSVSAIENGTVIDHIPAGQAVHLITLLKLTQQKNLVTIGLNLQGKSGLKDLLKMEKRRLTDVESRKIAIFAENATINAIENYKVIEKHTVQLPDHVEGILVCPNPVCVSNQEPTDSYFYLNKKQGKVQLRCKYCERAFDREDIKEYSA